MLVYGGGFLFCIFYIDFLNIFIYYFNVWN